MRSSILKNILFIAAAAAVMVLCVCAGSVDIPLSTTTEILINAVKGLTQENKSLSVILLTVRLPRVLCAALSGAALSLCGAAMQGVLKNPLADGSTMGVSAGASLGAVAAIILGVKLPQLPFSSVVVFAAVFAFGSLIAILALSYRIDRSFSANTLILLGIIFSMFVSSLMYLITAVFSDKLKAITFWTMGSFSGSTYPEVLVLLIVLVICGIVILSLGEELNAVAVGEENALSVGVDVKRVRLIVLITVSVLIGACVSVGGTISFVGLVTPHILRLITGPDHKKLLPACLFGGAIFLMLSDLVSRTVMKPQELPVGVITSFAGAFIFVSILIRSRRTAA